MESSWWICGMKSAGEHASDWSWFYGWLSQALYNFPQVFLTHTQAPLHWPPNSWNCGTSDWEVHLRCNTLLPSDDIPHSQDSAWWRNQPDEGIFLGSHRKLEDLDLEFILVTSTGSYWTQLLSDHYMLGMMPGTRVRQARINDTVSIHWAPVWSTFQHVCSYWLLVAISGSQPGAAWIFLKGSETFLPITSSCSVLSKSPNAPSLCHLLWVPQWYMRTF